MNFKEIATDIIQNYPEYSSPTLKCIKWGNYSDKMIFEVDDPNEDNCVLIFSIGTDKSCGFSFDDLAEAVKKMAHNHLDRPYAFFGWNPFDSGTYGADVVDAAMQMLFLGEIVYG